VTGVQVMCYITVKELPLDEGEIVGRLGVAL
jgi:hypothetical protein